MKISLLLFALAVVQLTSANREDESINDASANEAFDAPLSLYLNFTQIENWLQGSVKNKCPKLTLNIIGKTFEKRNIYAISISRNRTLPTVVIDGGIHAREWLAVSTSLILIHQFCIGSKDVDEILSKVQIHIIPVLNPDGYQFTFTKDGRFWRKNRFPNSNKSCPGVDLNRNFEKFWGEVNGSSGDMCNNNYRGSRANSELETQALAKFVQNVRPKIDFYLSFHSYGQFIVLPRKSSNHFEMKRVAENVVSLIKRRFNRKYRVGSLEELFGYSGSGSSHDYIAQTLGASYSYLMELTPSYLPKLPVMEDGFVYPQELINQIGKEIFVAFKTFVKDARLRV